MSYTKTKTAIAYKIAFSLWQTLFSMSKLKKESIEEVLGYKKIKSNEFCYVKWKQSKPSWENIKDIMSYTYLNNFLHELIQIRDSMKKKYEETKEEDHLNKLLLQYNKSVKKEEENVRRYDMDKEHKSSRKAGEPVRPQDESARSDYASRIKRDENVRTRDHDKLKHLQGSIKYDEGNVKKLKTFDQSYKGKEHTKLFGNTQISYSKDSKKDYRVEPKNDYKRDDNIDYRRDPNKVSNRDSKVVFSKDTQTFFCRDTIDKAKCNEEQAREMFIENHINQNVTVRGNRRYFQITEPFVPTVKKTITNEHKNTINLFIQNNNVATLCDVINIHDNTQIIPKTINLNKVIKLENLYNILFTARQNSYCSTLQIFRAFHLNSIPAYDEWCYKIKSNDLCFVDDSNETFYYFFCMEQKFFKLQNLDYEFLIFKVKKETLSDGTKNGSRSTANYISNLTQKHFSDLQWSVANFGFDKIIENYSICNFFEYKIKNKTSFLMHGNEQNYLIRYFYNFLIENNFDYRKNTEEIVDSVFVHKNYIDSVHLIPNFDSLLKSNTQFYLFGLENENKFLVPIFVSGGILNIFDSFFDSKFSVSELFSILNHLQNNTGKTWQLKISEKVRKKILERYDFHFTRKGDALNDWLASCVEDLDSIDDYNYYNQLFLKYYHEKRYFFALCNQDLGHRSKSICELLAFFRLKK